MIGPIRNRTVKKTIAPTWRDTIPAPPGEQSPAFCASGELWGALSVQSDIAPTYQDPDSSSELVQHGVLLRHEKSCQSAAGSYGTG